MQILLRVSGKNHDLLTLKHYTDMIQVPKLRIAQRIKSCMHGVEWEQSKQEISC